MTSSSQNLLSHKRGGSFTRNHFNCCPSSVWIDMNPKKCPKCGTWIKHSSNYNRHVKHCGTTEFECPDCKKSFSRKDALKRHSEKAQPQRKTTKGFFCKECQKPFTYAAALKLHEESCGNPESRPYH